MELFECEVCGVEFPRTGRGRLPRFCGAACRVRAHRRQVRRTSLPVEMTGRRQWTRRVGKRPVRVNGLPASVVDPSGWVSFAEARASRVGSGLGVMLGGGLACLDLDGCLDGDVLAGWAVDVVREVEPLWVERSMSGRGLHVFHLAPEAPGSRVGGVERYSRQRFIAVTLDRFDLGQVGAATM